jgi:hypothetical protein
MPANIRPFQASRILIADSAPTLLAVKRLTNLHVVSVTVPLLNIGLGISAVARKFVEVFGVTWAGSQITKVRFIKPIGCCLSTHLEDLIPVWHLVCSVLHTLALGSTMIRANPDQCWHLAGTQGWRCTAVSTIH